jgi:proteasome-associated ATPase
MEISDDEFERIRETLTKQEETLTAILQASSFIGIILYPSKSAEGKDSWIVWYQGGTLNVNHQPALTLECGDYVHLLQHQAGVGITGKIENRNVFSGNPARVVRLLPEQDRIGVLLGSEERLIHIGKVKDVKENDVVWVTEGIIADHIVEKAEPRHAIKASTGVSWNDIGGLCEVKEEVRRVIEEPIIHQDLYKAYKQPIPKGILLYGPPGNGKTMIGKAIATSLAEASTSNEVTESNFFSVKGPELLNKYVGQSEENIRTLFHNANTYYKKYKTPAVIFIDEAEAILSARGSRRVSDMETTIVPQFLSEMDGIQQSTAIVILATNRADMLDQAIIRDGRIDRKILIPNPDHGTAASILKVHLSRVGKEELHTGTTQMLFDNLPLYEVDYSTNKKGSINLCQVINGAMLAGLVQTATSYAIKRDIANKATTPSGVNEKDLEDAVKALYESHKKQDHSQQLQYIVEDLANDGISITNIRKVK